MFFRKRREYVGSPVATSLRPAESCHPATEAGSSRKVWFAPSQNAVLNARQSFLNYLPIPHTKPSAYAFLSGQRAKDPALYWTGTSCVTGQVTVPLWALFIKQVRLPRETSLGLQDVTPGSGIQTLLPSPNFTVFLECPSNWKPSNQRSVPLPYSEPQDIRNEYKRKWLKISQKGEGVVFQQDKKQKSQQRWLLAPQLQNLWVIFLFGTGIFQMAQCSDNKDRKPSGGGGQSGEQGLASLGTTWSRYDILQLSPTSLKWDRLNEGINLEFWFGGFKSLIH